MAIQQLKAYQDFIDFITSIPTLEQMAAYYSPVDAQARVSELLYANQNRRLTDAEVAELDDYQALGDLVQGVKIKAHIRLAAQKREATPIPIS